MFPVGSWLHICVGFLFGALTTGFFRTVVDVNKQPISKTILYRSLLKYSLLVSFTSFLYAAVLSGGILEEWKVLGKPASGETAVKILEIDYVQSQSGNTYYLNCVDCPEAKWEQVEDTPPNDQRPIKLSGSCGTFPFLPIMRIEHVDYFKACTPWGHGVATKVFAIDKSGNVYYWVNYLGEFGGFEMIAFPILGGGIGFIVGLVIILLRKPFQRKYKDFRDRKKQR